MKTDRDYIRENATKECAFLAELIEADDPNRYGDIARLAGTLRYRYEYLADPESDRLGLSLTRSEKRENGLGQGETDVEWNGVDDDRR